MIPYCSDHPTKNQSVKKLSPQLEKIKLSLNQTRKVNVHDDLVHTAIQYAIYNWHMRFLGNLAAVTPPCHPSHHEKQILHRLQIKLYSLHGIFRRVNNNENSEKLQVFIKRLNEAKPCNTNDEAFTLLANVLNEVEDEHSNIPYSPNKWMTDGRMYPPQADSRRATENPELVRYRNKAHNTFIGRNGSIKIEEINSRIVIDKAGSDGRRIDDL